MNPTTYSASLKKIHQFLRNLVEGLSNSFYCKLRLCTIKYGADSTCHYISSDAVYG